MSATIAGWICPRADLAPRLARWAGAGGMESVVDHGAFGLWRMPQAPAHTFDTGAEAGVLIGSPYGSAGDEALRSVLRARREGRLDRLEGRLALILWEPGQARLTLFRDGSGASRLYHRELAGGGIVFSDDLDLLAQGPGGERRLERASLHEYLRFMDVSTPNTLLAGVRSPEPGIERVYRLAGGFEDVARGQAPPPRIPQGPEGALDALEARLLAAIERRLPADGPVLAFLSGGIDSSLIAALAARLAPGRVSALTVGFEEAHFDETPVAAAIAGHLGLPHQVLRIPTGDYRPAFDEWSRRIAYPFADPAAVPTLLAFRAGRELAPVAFDGTGADTLLGIMPARHYRQAATWGSRVPRPLRPGLARLLRAAGPLAGLAPLVDFDDPEEILIRWRAWPRREIERLCGEPVSLAHTRYYRIYRGFAPNQHFERYSALMGNLPDDRIHEAARLTGLEVLFPFFDAEVVDLVRALPMALRYRDGEHKVILRQLLARHVPRAIWDVPKHGFDFPFADFMRVDDHALIRDYLPDARVRASGLVDADIVAATVARFRAGDDRLAFRVWALVVLFAWLANHWGGEPWPAAAKDRDTDD